MCNGVKRNISYMLLEIFHVNMITSINWISLGTAAVIAELFENNTTHRHDSR